MGIGGSGMYPLAQILHKAGCFITGSDNNETETLAAVRKMGIEVTLGQKAENIVGSDLIVYTAAIAEDNPELAAAKASGAALLERAELLGLMSKEYDFSICVSGTDGKTTVTSMITEIFVDSGYDISAVIGGKLPAIGGSGVCGDSDVFVVESCEFKNHFLSLSPAISLILNINCDHMDFFGTMENLKKSFRTFAEAASRAVIANGDDENTTDAIKGLDKRIITFGKSEGNDFYPANIKRESPFVTRFTVMKNGEPLTEIVLSVPGEHNIINAVAAAAAADFYGVKPFEIAAGLGNFRGAARRFEKFGEVRGITVVDDYAHNPTEIGAVLKTAKTLGFARVWAVHQPFTFSRTAQSKNEFAEVLATADKCVLACIRGGREVNTYGIHTSDLAALVPGAVWFENENQDENFALIVDYIAENANTGDLVITLGCGDSNKIARALVKRLGD
ncbi:MAG: UDP-N-acetylmuramate--L-alanine ligase [Ruminococcus sp.]|nr:UDP-N-acetylmuramate--L-alanine ligase [Ruminococcus sp.]